MQETLDLTCHGGATHLKENLSATGSLGKAGRRTRTTTGMMKRSGNRLPVSLGVTWMISRPLAAFKKIPKALTGRMPAANCDQELGASAIER